MAIVTNNVGDAGVPSPRDVDDVVAMAIAVQANVVQLRTAASKRATQAGKGPEIQVPSPGAVIGHREALIDRRRIKAYSDDEICIRLHGAWGQFCALCWSLSVVDPNRPPRFAAADDAVELRCQSALECKAVEINGWLWRLIFEQRIRADAHYRDSAGFDREEALAKQIPVVVSSRPVTECDDEAVLAASCEHAGMLGAIRWVGDRRWSWGQSGIMDFNHEDLFGLGANSEGGSD